MDRASSLEILTLSLRLQGYFRTLALDARIAKDSGKQTMVFSVELLGAWYGAQQAQSLALSSAGRSAASSSQTASAAQNAGEEVLPPWDPRRDNGA